jgi:transformation/transcription domain-associated protein
MPSTGTTPSGPTTPVTLSLSDGTQPTPADAAIHFATMRGHIQVLNDTSAKDEAKLKAAQELSDNLDIILASPHYPAFLEQSLGVFKKFLDNGNPHFIAEQHAHQVRKLVLEIIQRLPANDHLKAHTRSILLLAFKLLKVENEENVLVCLRIIIELHKQFRPPHSIEITSFLQFVKSIYKELPNHLNDIFEPKDPIKINDLAELKIDDALNKTFTVTAIVTGKKATAGDTNAQVTYNLIPRAVLSLKVLQELPIIVVLMYQLYKQFVYSEVSEFIPLIMNTITLQPTELQRHHTNFNREVFVDFMGAQIKTLSFLAYIIRLYQEVVSIHSTQMVKGILSLLTVCPHEVAHLRKELLIGICIFTTDRILEIIFFYQKKKKIRQMITFKITLKKTYF